MSWMESMNVILSPKWWRTRCTQTYPEHEQWISKVHLHCLLLIVMEATENYHPTLSLLSSLFWFFHLWNIVQLPIKGSRQPWYETAGSCEQQTPWMIKRQTLQLLMKKFQHLSKLKSQVDTKLNIGLVRWPESWCNANVATNLLDLQVDLRCIRNVCLSFSAP